MKKRKHVPVLWNTLLVFIVMTIFHVFIIQKESTSSVIRKLHCSMGYSLHLPDKDLMQKPSAKIYTPFPLEHAMIFGSKYPGETNEYPSDILIPVAGWLRIHHEYLASAYMMHRLFHDRRIQTSDIENAELCFPSCSTTEQFRLTQGNTLQLRVRPGFEPKYYGCNVLSIGIDTPTSPCSFNVPYWHSMYYPKNQTIEPWRFNFTRINNLCYAGGIRRGHLRKRVLSELKSTKSLKFASFDVQQTDHTEDERWATPYFYIKVWELYASSDFSWQPEGDSSTRRGFFDSWMLGCIPVISQSAACVYSGLFGGYLFSAPRPTIGNIAVVLDDKTMMHGAAILWHLSKITSDDIERRRRWMADLAPLMQWGWNEQNGHTDALIGVLNAFAQNA